MPKTRRGFSTKVWVVTPDKHFAHSQGGVTPIDRHDPAALSVVLQIVKDIRPDAYVDLGDLVHLGYISHFAIGRDMQGRVPSITGDSIVMNLKNDHLLINVWLDKIQEACRKDTEFYQLEGNHEEIFRNTRGMRKFDGYDISQFYPEQLWNLKERGIKWVPYQRYGEGAKNWVEVGKHLKLIHGQYVSVNHLAKHWQHWNCNLIYGHLHSRETKDFPHPIASSTVQTIGCLCTKYASYHRGRNNAWSQGISVIHLLPNGTFRDEFVRILDGQAVYNGKVYTAKRERWME